MTFSALLQNRTVAAGAGAVRESPLCCRENTTRHSQVFLCLACFPPG